MGGGRVEEHAPDHANFGRLLGKVDICGCMIYVLAQHVPITATFALKLLPTVDVFGLVQVDAQDTAVGEGEDQDIVCCLG